MESKQTYGSPRICKALKAKEILVSRPRVARLMKQAYVRAKRIKRFKVTTDSKHSYLVSENLLDRKFTATTIGQSWVSDITYIKTMKAKDTTIAAFKMAVKNRPIIWHLIFHSDRDIQRPTPGTPVMNSDKN